MVGLEEKMEPIIWMNMSGVYELEDFYRHNHFQWKEIDLRSVKNTNCYVDEETKQEIRDIIAPLTERIHFIDSGNYHYLSLLWMEKIEEDFELIVLDEHPDMQMPAFGRITSCGAWVREAVETLPHLKKIYHLGAEEALMEEVWKEWPEGRKKIHVVSQENNTPEYWRGIWEETKWNRLPVYISIDKDVMGRSECPCDWSQGVMKFKELEHFLATLPEDAYILGLDVCGEESADDFFDAKRNEKINLKLAGDIERVFKRKRSS